MINKEIIEFWYYIKSAVEKQIPKTPIEDGYYDIPCVCPQCGTELRDKNNYCCYCGQAIDFSDEKWAKAVDVAYDEKQIPKKPIYNGIVYFCPICKGSLWQNKDESKYCFRCGQRIDWSIK